MKIMKVEYEKKGKMRNKNFDICMRKTNIRREAVNTFACAEDTVIMT